MEISFAELKNKEIINILDGKKLGHIIDILFDNNGIVKGIVVPGEKKIFRKNEDIFVPLSLIKKIGDDVILVRIETITSSAFLNKNFHNEDGLKFANSIYFSQGQSNKGSFVRYRRVDNKKYK